MIGSSSPIIRVPMVSQVKNQKDSRISSVARVFSLQAAQRLRARARNSAAMPRDVNGRIASVLIARSAQRQA
jgi:hypothetical protein